jgi:uncharacterized protein YndB with AHSA1/START domain
MSTSTFDPSQAAAIGPWAGCFPAEKLYTVSSSRSVRADRARIFQAITVPEYMEAWFSAPGSIPGYTRVLGGDRSFSVFGPTDDGARFRISCTYRVYRRSKLVFSWEQNSLAEATPSIVKIRLLGDFERTTVDVTHTGISELERQWCELLWEASLEKLSRLF